MKLEKLIQTYLESLPDTFPIDSPKLYQMYTAQILQEFLEWTKENK